MARLREWIHRFWGTLRGRRHDRDLEDELALHVALAEESVAGEDPARRARLRTGGRTQAIEALRDQRGLPWVDDLWRDVRYGLRSLRRTPGFALIAISTLALGIGATTTIFSVVNAALIRPLPYPEPERLVSLYSVDPDHSSQWPVAPADYFDWREQSTTIEHLAAYSGSGLSLWIGERPEAVPGARVTANFFDTLGVEPLLGSGFGPEDEITVTSKVMLSHRFWQTHLGADPTVVGRSLRTTDGSITVAGVMPPEFEYPGFADVWTPMGCCGENGRRAVRYWTPVGRLGDDATPEAAQAELEAISVRLGELYPTDNGGWSADVVPFTQAEVQDIRQALWMLMGAVGFVIVIACANVAGLTLARATARRREVAVRLALGATRWRLVRQLFVEGLLLSGVGSVLGLVIARWGVGAFFGLVPETSWTSLVRYRDRVDLDATVLIFAAAMMTVTAVVLTLVPVRDARKLALAESVHTRGSQGSRHEHRAYKTLVAAQVACAIVLLAGAGLLARSFVRLTRVDTGYDPRGLITMTVPIGLQGMPAFVSGTLEQIQAAPGVDAAALMSNERFGQLNFPFNLAEAPLPGGDVVVRYSAVTPDYFRVLGSRALTGRVFDSRDAAEAPGVAVINDTLARQYFARDEDPVGRALVLVYNNQRIPRRIIGVVTDIRQDEPNQPVRPEILVPWSQLPWMAGTLVVRANGDAAAAHRRVQDIIWDANGNLPASRTRMVEDVLRTLVATPRLYAILLGLFSGLAVTLAVIGLYGLLAYVVGRRTNEIAIRFALGARHENILRLVIGEGLRLSAVGIVVGLVGAVAVTRVMQGLLFEVTPTDPVTLAAVAVLLLAVAAAACYVPARRAANTSPMVALRSE